MTTKITTKNDFRKNHTGMTMLNDYKDFSKSILEYLVKKSNHNDNEKIYTKFFPK